MNNAIISKNPYTQKWNVAVVTPSSVTVDGFSVDTLREAVDATEQCGKVFVRHWWQKRGRKLNGWHRVR